MIVRVMAGIVVNDLSAARTWYTAALGHEPDDTPMAGLLEWHINDGGWVQVVDVASVREIQQMPGWGGAGSSSAALVVDDLDERLARLEAAGTPCGPQHTTPRFRTATFTDPSGNLITFVELLRRPD